MLPVPQRRRPSFRTITAFERFGDQLVVPVGPRLAPGASCLVVGDASLETLGQRCPESVGGLTQGPVADRPPGGWSTAPARCPWGLARSRTRNRRFRGRSGRVREYRRARRLVSASLRGRPHERTHVPRPAPPVRPAGTPEALRSPRLRVRRSSTGVPAPSQARRTPGGTPSRKGRAEALRSVRIGRLDLPPDHVVLGHAGSSFTRIADRNTKGGRYRTSRRTKDGPSHVVSGSSGSE